MLLQDGWSYLTPAYFFYKKVLTDEYNCDIIGGPRAVAASGFHYNTCLALLSSGNFAQKLQKNIPKFVYFAQRKIFFVTFHKIFVYFCIICTLQFVMAFDIMYLQGKG